MSLFINNALAAAANGPAEPGRMSGTLMLMIGFIVIFYFLLWRPQSKRNKAHRQLLSSLNTGDEVVTNSGILGKIIRITDSFVVLSISESIEIKMQKPAIVSVVPKGTIKEI